MLFNLVSSYSLGAIPKEGEKKLSLRGKIKRECEERKGAAKVPSHKKMKERNEKSQQAFGRAARLWLEKKENSYVRSQNDQRRYVQSVVFQPLLEPMCGP